MESAASSRLSTSMVDQRQDRGVRALRLQDGPTVPVFTDNRMPMKLRMLGEKVYGNSPGGASSDGMMSMTMAVENGTMGSTIVSHLDLNRGRFHSLKLSSVKISHAYLLAGFG